MTINYITYDSWWDTDITVLPKLSDIYKVNVFCLNPQSGMKYPKKTVPLGISFYQVFQKYHDRDPRSFLTALKFFYKSVIKNDKSDPIYFFIPGKNPWLLLLMLYFLPKNRTIISSHNYIEHGDRNDLGASLLDRLKRRFYNKFNFFHFFSKGQLDLFRNDFPNKTAFSTEMPVKDYGKATAVTDSDSKVHLLFFGLIRDYKRLDWLIEGVKAANTKKIKVTIAGNASEDDIKKYNKIIGNDESFETHFGFVKNEDIPNYFSESDFLVLPYKSATQSGPSLIAINYGIPIIASDIPTFRTLITNGVNGFLFPETSFDSLAKILKYISGMTDEQIGIMKKNQKEFKKEYINKNDISKAFSNYINRYLLRT